MELSKYTNVQGLQKRKPQESKKPPGSGSASLRCTAGLVLQLHAACELPTKGGRDGARVTGRDELEVAGQDSLQGCDQV